MKFLLNCIKMIYMNSTVISFSEFNIRNGTKYTHPIFEKNHEALVDNFNEKPLLVKNVYSSNSESHSNADRPQPSSSATVRFLIFSKKFDAKLGKGLENVLESLNKEDLENNIKKFSDSSENNGIIKMVFEASVDFNMPGTSIKSDVIFPDKKMLLALKVTPESDQEDNFNLKFLFRGCSIFCALKSFF